MLTVWLGRMSSNIKWGYILTKSELIAALEKLGIGLRRGAVEHIQTTQSLSKAFGLVKDLVEPILSKGCVIHIGSTSVPHCLCKPILDIAIEYPENTLPGVDAQNLENIGFTGKGEYGISGRYFYVLYDDELEHSYVHLHAFNRTHPHLLSHISFKNALIKSPRLIDEYGHLKMTLIQKGLGRREYTEAKAGFINQVLKISD